MFRTSYKIVITDIECTLLLVIWFRSDSKKTMQFLSLKEKEVVSKSRVM